MEDKKKPKRRKSTRLNNTAQILECNLFFLDEVDRLKAKKNLVREDLIELRRNLSSRNIAQLSSLWDEYLERRIKINFALDKCEISASPIKQYVTTGTKERHYAIEVFPETTDDEVLRSFKRIITDDKQFFKPPLQPMKTVNYEYAKSVVQSYRAGMKPMEIFRESYGAEYTLIHKIIRRAKKGYQK